MTCGYPASEFRPYAPRARWIRTANDSYFTAMTYPEGLPALLQPSDLHDAIWGVFAAVYGGAVHPTAEGHAAMADAALPAARAVLGLRPAGRTRAQRAAAAAAKFRSRASCRRPAGSRVAGCCACARRRAGAGTRHATPSFFCRLDDDVVYWNTSRLSG